MEGSMAETGKPSIVAAFVIACSLAGLAPTAAMAQIPFMIPNFNFGPQHYRGSSHYSTRSHSRHEEDKAPEKVDKTKEKDATQPDATASAPRTQQTSGPPPSHDAAPSGGSGTSASPPPASPAKQNNDDQPAFQPSR
jgi:predicted lipid-binding transport protein (Tim44 family)